MMNFLLYGEFTKKEIEINLYAYEFMEILHSLRRYLKNEFDLNSRIMELNPVNTNDFKDTLGWFEKFNESTQMQKYHNEAQNYQKLCEKFEKMDGLEKFEYDINNPRVGSYEVRLAIEFGLLNTALLVHKKLMSHDNSYESDAQDAKEGYI